MESSLNGDKWPSDNSLCNIYPCNNFKLVTELTLKHWIAFDLQKIILDGYTNELIFSWKWLFESLLLLIEQLSADCGYRPPIGWSYTDVVTTFGIVKSVVKGGNIRIQTFSGKFGPFFDHFGPKNPNLNFSRNFKPYGCTVNWMMQGQFQNFWRCFLSFVQQCTLQCC